MEVEEDGYFIYEILGYDNTAIVSIPDDDYYIPANIPPNNNKVFISNAIGNEKHLFHKC